MKRRSIADRGPIRVLVDNAKPASPAGVLARLKDVAPLITGIGTLLLSLVSFYYVRSQDRQKSDLAIADIRLKALPAANETDPAKQEVGAMGVAIYGKTAVPVIRFLLSGSSANRNMRPFGVLVVRHWLDSADAQGRADVLSELTSCARADSANLREGAYAALAGIAATLSKQEDAQVLALLQERFGAPNGPAETNGDVAFAACKLLNKYQYSAVRTALLAMAKTAPDQAVESYITILGNLCDPQARRQFGSDVAAAGFPKRLEDRRAELVAAAQGGCSP